MGTNGTETATAPWLGEEALRIQTLDRPPAAPETEADRPRGLREATPDLALAPLVDKIAFGLARGLVVAMKELENHIASETRKVSESVGRRLDTLQASFQDLTEVVSEQRSMSLSVQEKCEQLSVATAALQESDARQAAELMAVRNDTRELSDSVAVHLDGISKDLAVQKTDSGKRLETLQTGFEVLTGAVAEQQSIAASVQEKLAATTASLQESDARQAAELGVLRHETKEFSAAVNERIDALCKELGVHQEDMAAVKFTLCGFSSRVDTVVDRLDRQADALRSMYSTYSQRETELEQLVDGLARLRAYPTPLAANRL
jgi:chromosome segregation ATPase